MMSQRQRIIQIPLLGGLLLGLLATVYLVTWKRFSKSGPAKIAGHSVDTSPADTLNYWTADKMRNTEATNMPTTNALRRKKKQPHRPPHTPDSQNA